MQNLPKTKNPFKGMHQLLPQPHCNSVYKQHTCEKYSRYRCNSGWTDGSTVRSMWYSSTAPSLLPSTHIKQLIFHIFDVKNMREKFSVSSFSLIIVSGHLKGITVFVPGDSRSLWSWNIGLVNCNSRNMRRKKQNKKGKMGRGAVGEGGGR